MTGVLSVEVAGEELVLDADRAAYWRARRTLLVTDVHFGKAHVLRRAGVALPRGSTTADLARLDALIARHSPERVVVLGDVVHGTTDEEAQWLSRVREWRAKHPALHLSVVRGNHDRHYDPTLLGFAVTGTLLEPPFAFAHYAKPIRGAYVLAGHIHPGVELSSYGDRVRLPVFWFGRDVGVLPAFGRLTGLYMIEPEADDKLVAVARDTLLPLNAKAYAPRPEPRGFRRFRAE